MLSAYALNARVYGKAVTVIDIIRTSDNRVIMLFLVVISFLLCVGFWLVACGL